MKNNYITWRNASLLIMMGFLTLQAACKKFVQIGAPNTQVVATTVFSDNNAATAALTVIYSQMQQESWSMSQISGLLSDELQSPSSAGGIYLPYTNALTAIGSLGPWSRAYNYIFEANAVIQGLKGSNSIDAAIGKQLTGEAKFIRGFWNFYLTNCYGDIPLVTTTDYTINSSLARTPRSQVYDNIIADLKDAESLLNYDYVDASDTATSLDHIRPNKAAATALLARVYLFARRYPEAEMASADLLGDTRYSLVQDLNQVFLKNSQEAIWQLGIPTPASYNTVDANYFILQAAPNPTSSVNAVTISTWLTSSFEAGDVRRTAWIGSVSAGGTDYYFPYKYKNISANITEYTMMLRLSEQYLIHAEALVRQNKDLEQAVNDINNVRHRAGLGDYMGLHDNADSLLAAILHERRVELFTEWGHRWFDLIRTGNINAIMDTITPLKGGAAWRPEWALYPIPLSEMQIDFNLTQNPGYE